MAKHKKGRVGVRVDMTAMVDVGFLLLTFFMLATTFKPPEQVQIELPSSHSAFKLPGKDVMMITVSKDGGIFLGVDTQVLRERLFGRENMLKAGIQVERASMSNLIIQARIMNPRLSVVVKGDKGAPFGPIEDVMDVLQKTRVTRFNLITDLEND